MRVLSISIKHGDAHAWAWGESMLDKHTRARAHIIRSCIMHTRTCMHNNLPQALATCDVGQSQFKYVFLTKKLRFQLPHYLLIYIQVKRRKMG